MYVTDLIISEPYSTVSNGKVKDVVYEGLALRVVVGSPKHLRDWSGKLQI